jgi:hypothetical protein
MEYARTFSVYLIIEEFKDMSTWDAVKTDIFNRD